MSFCVFRCKKCGRYIYANSSNKTRKCVCGYTNSLNKVRIIAKVEDEKLAAELVRLKQGSGTDFIRLGGR